MQCASDSTISCSGLQNFEWKFHVPREVPPKRSPLLKRLSPVQVKQSPTSSHTPVNESREFERLNLEQVLEPEDANLLTKLLACSKPPGVAETDEFSSSHSLSEESDDISSCSYSTSSSSDEADSNSIDEAECDIRKGIREPTLQNRPPWMDCGERDIAELNPCKLRGSRSFDCRRTRLLNKPLPWLLSTDCLPARFPSGVLDYALPTLAKSDSMSSGLTKSASSSSLEKNIEGNLPVGKERRRRSSSCAPVQRIVSQHGHARRVSFAPNTRVIEVEKKKEMATKASMRGGLRSHESLRKDLLRDFSFTDFLDPLQGLIGMSSRRISKTEITDKIIGQTQVTYKKPAFIRALEVRELADVPLELLDRSHGSHDSREPNLYLQTAEQLKDNQIRQDKSRPVFALRRAKTPPICSLISKEQDMREEDQRRGRWKAKYVSENARKRKLQKTQPRNLKEKLLLAAEKAEAAKRADAAENARIQELYGAKLFKQYIAREGGVMPSWLV